MSRDCRACAHDVQYSFGLGAPCVCSRVFGSYKGYWDKEPGYVKAEVKAALRRAPVDKRRRSKVWPYGYLKLDYTLPCPSLAASVKRLAGARLTILGKQIGTDRHFDGSRFIETPEYETLEVFEGPRAAEQYILYRRAQLGLDLEMAA